MKGLNMLLQPDEACIHRAIQLARDDPKGALDVLKASGLRGRSGSSFPTGIKWEMTAQCSSAEKYVVCNADEGEPGTFKDRALLELAAENVVCGIVVCGILTEAVKGYIYLREEYSSLKAGIETAIQKLSPDFPIEVYAGCGSYVCGEETALLESLEGRRGEPQNKPPYPSSAGLFGKPTVISNVETFANVPFILSNGAEAFRMNGTPKHTGTKLVSLSGCVENPGVYEFPLGTTIGEIFETAGGCPEGKKLKGMQIGGGSGAVAGLDALSAAFDDEGCAKAGASTGTGSILFFDETCDVLDLCLNISEFFEKESCGKCAPCRLGNQRIHAILEDMYNNGGTPDDLEKLESLGRFMTKSAACGLGQAAAMPLLSALRSFKDDFLKHLRRSSLIEE